MQLVLEVGNFHSTCSLNVWYHISVYISHFNIAFHHTRISYCKLHEVSTGTEATLCCSDFISLYTHPQRVYAYITITAHHILFFLNSVGQIWHSVHKCAIRSVMHSSQPVPDCTFCHSTPSSTSNAPYSTKSTLYSQSTTSVVIRPQVMHAYGFAKWVADYHFIFRRLQEAHAQLPNLSEHHQIHVPNKHQKFIQHTHLTLLSTVRVSNHSMRLHSPVELLCSFWHGKQQPHGISWSLSNISSISRPQLVMHILQFSPNIVQLRILTILVWNALLPGHTLLSHHIHNAVLFLIRLTTHPTSTRTFWQMCAFTSSETIHLNISKHLHHNSMPLDHWPPTCSAASQF